MFFRCQLGIKSYYTGSLFNCCYRNGCWLINAHNATNLLLEMGKTVRKGWSERHLVRKVWSEDFFGLENLIRGNFGLEIGSESISVWKVWSEKNLCLDLKLGSLFCLFFWEDFMYIWLSDGLLNWGFGFSSKLMLSMTLTLIAFNIPCQIF